MRFYAREMDAAKRDGLLISLHLKATMMKVSDPILFGHGGERVPEGCIREAWRRAGRRRREPEQWPRSAARQGRCAARSRSAPR